MRNLLLASFLLLASTAHAGKARLTALQGLNTTAGLPNSTLAAFPGAPFLVDTQTIFINPAHINSKAQYVTFEGGGTGAASAPKAEGGFARKMGSSNMGAYFGHQSPTQSLLRTTLGTTFLMPQNPIEITFGKDRWGAAVGLSNSETIQGGATWKESSVTGRFGTYLGDAEIYGSAELISISKNDTANNEVNGPVLTFGYEKPWSNTYFVVNAVLGAGNYKVAGTSESWRDVTLSVGLLDRAMSQSKIDIYYGAYLNYVDFDLRTKQMKGLEIPFVLGVEADLLSWTIIRASVTQSFFIGSMKNEGLNGVGSSSINPQNNTTVAAGLGLKIAQGLTADATLAAMTSGQLDGNNMLANASMTYAF